MSTWSAVHSLRFKLQDFERLAEGGQQILGRINTLNPALPKQRCPQLMRD
jgi:hypothetical protein